MERIKIEKVNKIPDDIQSSKIMNINVGVLGHIDSGKTSLVKKLIENTHKMEQEDNLEEGITLDLVFSIFYLKTPAYLKIKYSGNERLVNSEYLQITLVDCPGHSSLIKTMIAGANIIDTIVLVLDVMKGIQTQTTECLVLGEILVDKMIIALNKIDLIPASTREKEIENKILKLRSAFSVTKFGYDVTIIPVSGNPKCTNLINTTNTLELTKNNVNENNIKMESSVQFSKDDNEDYNKLIDNLVSSVLDSINFNKHNVNNLSKKDFLFSIDHCLNFCNKDTFLTGTILKGKINVNDEIYFPGLCEKKTIKDIQIFNKPISTAFQGDRIGLHIENLDYFKIENTLAFSEGYIKYAEGGLFLLKKVNFYKHEIKSNTKFYVIFGNQGIMAKCIFFNPSFPQNNNLYIEHDSQNIMNTIVNMDEFYNSEFSTVNQLVSSDDYIFAYLKFDHKIFVPPDMIALGSKIDFDVSYKANRIAFYGKLIDIINPIDLENTIKICEKISKIGSIVRLLDERTAIVKGLFNKKIIAEEHLGRNVTFGEYDNINGIISSSVGLNGEVTVKFDNNIKLTNTDGSEFDYSKVPIILEFKKNLKIFSDY